MKKYTLGIIGALLAISNSSAKDNNHYVRADAGVTKSEKIKSVQNFYKISGNKSFNSSPIYSIGFGYRINDKFRSEIAYSYTDLKYKRTTPALVSPNKVTEFKQKVNIQTGMINLFYDVVTYQKLTPYLGVGIGYAKINPKEASISNKRGQAVFWSNKSENMTYSLMGGLSINMTNKLNFDIGYKFQDFGKAKGFNKAKLAPNPEKNITPKSFKIKAHIATAGIRYSF